MLDLIKKSNRSHGSFKTSLLLITLMLMLLVKPLAAEENRIRKWEFMISGGLTISDKSPSDYERGMIAGHLDGEVCGDVAELFCVAFTMPHNDIDRLSFNISLDYLLSPRHRVQFFFSKTSFGSTKGYFDGGDRGTSVTDADLEIGGKSITAIGIIGQYTPISIIRIGFGPALYILNYGVGHWVGVVYEQNHLSKSLVNMGLAAGLSINVPARTRFFVSASIQYRYSGDYTLGPFDATNMRGEVLTSMPQTRVSMNHVIVFVGIGFRG